MVARNRARYLAPIALAAALAGTYIVVHAGLTTKHQAHAGTARRRSARNKFAEAKFYVVQPGDSLSSISAKTKVPVTELENLNPSIDPNTLQTGRRLRLRR